MPRTVDSSPSVHGPPSRIMAGRRPSSASTWAAVVGLTRPERLALGAAMGSLAALRRSRAVLLLGERSATVSRPALTRSAMAQPDLRGSTRDTGPGQKAFISLRAVSLTAA